MNEITPEQALADIRAVRRDRADSYWFACACALADKNEADVKLVLQLQKEGDDFRKDCERLDCENAKLVDEIVSARSAVRVADDVLAKLLAENTKLRAELDAKEHAARIAAAEIRLQKMQLADLRAELDTYKRIEKRTIEEGQKLRAELHNAKDHITRLRCEGSTARLQVEQLRAELETYKAAKNSIMEESQNLRAKLDRTERLNKKLRAMAGDYLDQIDSLREEVESRRAAVRVADDVLAKLRTENAKLRAELDALKSAPVQDARRAHLDALDDAAPEAPALSRFLPVRPDDIPAPPDGWVYCGKGTGETVNITPEIAAFINKCWDKTGWGGYYDDTDYAIRWTAPADIWHRFGMIAPSEGGGWIPHTPGDAMPCDANLRVNLLFANGRKPCESGVYFFDAYTVEHNNDIIGWRPALAEVAT
jgi:hypothetical protein